MHRGSTLFLRLVVLFIGIVALTICVYALWIGIASGKPDNYIPVLVGLCIPAIPFYVALYQTMKLLDYIDKNKAFSSLSIAALQIIKYCAVIIAVMFTLLSPYVYRITQEEDAPGILLLNLIIIGASIVIATFAAVLQKLLQSAIAIKSENDLTV